MVLGRVADPARPYPDLPFYSRQVGIVTRNCGFIDPTSLADYEAAGGYQALRKALSMEPMAIIEAVKASGLRGRSGAGFPTGKKWEFAHRAPGPKKYVICNATRATPAPTESLAHWRARTLIPSGRYAEMNITGRNCPGGPLIYIFA